MKFLSILPLVLWHLMTVPGGAAQEPASPPPEESAEPLWQDVRLRDYHEIPPVEFGERTPPIVAALTLEDPVNYWEMRNAFTRHRMGYKDGFLVKAVAGKKCDGARDPAACNQKFDSLVYSGGSPLAACPDSARIT